MEKMITCIICPHGCEIRANGEPDANYVEQIEGHRCQRGHTYARQEFLSPCRILTASIRVAEPGRRMLPVRSLTPVPLELLLPCIAEIKKLVVHVPVNYHQTILSDILGTGADIVACTPLE